MKHNYVLAFYFLLVTLSLLINLLKDLYFEDSFNKAKLYQFYHIFGLF